MVQDNTAGTEFRYVNHASTPSPVAMEETFISGSTSDAVSEHGAGEAGVVIDDSHSAAEEVVVIENANNKVSTEGPNSGALIEKISDNVIDDVNNMKEVIDRHCPGQ